MAGSKKGVEVRDALETQVKSLICIGRAAGISLSKVVIGFLCAATAA